MVCQTELNMTQSRNHEVVIGLSIEKLLELMRLGVLCGADIHALDSETKQLVQKACLQSCADKVCKDCRFSDTCGVDWNKINCLQCQKRNSPNH